MSKNLLAILLLVLTAAIPARGQEPRAAGRYVRASIDRESMPWVVSVVHTIDLQKMLTRWKQERKLRVGLPPSAPPFVYNIATGVVVDDKGHVVTRLSNLDASEKVQRLDVTTVDGSTLPARLVGVDYATGFAVLEVPSLKVAPPKLVQAPKVDIALDVRILSADVHKTVGSDGVAKLHLSPTFRASQGRVLAGGPFSKARRALTLLSDDFRSRSDSSVIIDFDNNVVGVAEYAGFGRGYVFPFAYIRDTVAERVLESKGNVPAGWLGIVGDAVAKLPDADVSALGLSSKKGVLVREVVPESPAAASGIQSTDVIVGIDNIDIASTADLGLLLSSYPAGTSIHVREIRRRAPVDLKVVLGAKPLAQQQQAPYRIFPKVDPTPDADVGEIKNRLDELGSVYRSFAKSPPSLERTDALRELEAEIRYLQDSLRAITPSGPTPPLRSAVVVDLPAPFTEGTLAVQQERALMPLGFWARELTPQLAAAFDVSGGMLVDSVIKDSVADRAGLTAGDVLIEANGRPLLKLTQLQVVLAGEATQFELRVVRDKHSATLTIHRP